MPEQLPILTHDKSAQFTIIEGIQNISKFVGAEVAERMIQEFRDGRGIIAEDDRLEADIAACIQQQQIIEEQIRQDELRRQELAPQLETALKREAEMQMFIDGFAKFVQGEGSQGEATSELAQTARVIPPQPTVAPKVPIVEKRPLSEFRDTSVQRPLGRMAVIQAVVSSGNKY